MEINGADLANKKQLDDVFLRKYWRIKDAMKRNILLEYIKKNTPNATLQVYTSVPLKTLDHSQVVELLKSDDGVKKIIDFDALDQAQLIGEDLDDLKDRALIAYWNMKNASHRKIILDYIA